MQHWVRIAGCASIFLLSLACGISPVLSQEPPEEHPQFSAGDLEFFEREVRPILAERCYECHGPQAEEPRGGLSFASREALLLGGDSGPALEPGDADASLIVEAVRYDGFYEMPPRSKMPDEEIAVLEDWVARGAPWPAAAESSEQDLPRRGFDLAARRESHWAWHPPLETAPPAVADEAWPAGDIDRYILARLEEAGLAPSAAADRRTLIRRLYFDLIGLPPTPEEVQAFVDDPSPQAYETLVDRLLASERFGERWARHWLDLARYCETGGHEFDYPIEHAWHYRDYVIRAFNEDVPYDQFVTEQIAGDLLAEPRRNLLEGYNESILGTGFWYFNEWKHAPVDPIKEEADLIDNRIEVFSKTFLGMTVACARCHDHKFDAISTRDYYSLAGFLASTRRQEALLDPHGEIAEITAQLEELRAQGSQRLAAAMPPADEAEADRFAQLLLSTAAPAAEVPVSLEESSSPSGGLAAALAEPLPLQHPLWLWQQLAPLPADQWPARQEELAQQLAESQTQLDEQLSGTVLFEDFSGPDFGGWTVTGQAFGDSPTRCDKWNNRATEPAFQIPGVVHSGLVSRGEQGVLRSPSFTITHPQMLWHMAGRNCQVRVIIENYVMDIYNHLLYIDCTIKVDTGDRLEWVVQSGSLGHYIGYTAHLEIVDHGDGWVAVDEIRFADGPPPGEPAHPAAAELLAASPSSLEDLAGGYGELWRQALAAVEAGQANPSQVSLVNWGLAQSSFAEGDEQLAGELDDLRANMGDVSHLLPAPVHAVAMLDADPEDWHVHVRGNPHMHGELAPRGLLEAIDVPRQPLPATGSGRLELAREVVDPANPLTSRVMVNRVWQHLFGQGIVPTPDNFGVQGIPPSHPELLDHLALEFMHDGWSVKRLIRRMVLSNTYRQTSLPTAGDAVDPENRLLHRQNLRRLEGEAIRDALLAVSGRLDTTMYGPSEPIHVTPFMASRGQPSVVGELDGSGRRSVYIEVRRNFLSPFMLAFDTPPPTTTTGRRTTSNVPAQSLILMNDEFVAGQARLWAERLLNRESLSFAERIDRLYQEAFARQATADEQAALADFFNMQADEYGLSTEERVDDARLWADLCHVLINVKKFIYID